MSKIDTEKFIVDILQQLMEGHPLKVNILYALLKQGLVYTDGSIVRIVNMKKGPSLEEAITNEPIITKEPDIDMDAMVEDFKHRNRYHSDNGIVRTYRKGLEDMFNKMKK